GAGEKRPSNDLGKKPKNQKKKKKKDPNEPQKPVSAYALFFRDTQAAIKGQNPNATFGDVSKIVASMWDSLGEEQKQAYKRKTEAAKKEYLKALAAYRASLVSKSYTDQGEAKNSQPNQPSKMILPKQSMYNLPPQSSSPYPGLASFLSPAELPSYRGHPHPSLSRTLNAKSMLPSLSASPPPPFQISPPLHQHLRHPPSSLLNQSLNMQPSSIGLQSPMSSSPTGQQNLLSSATDHNCLFFATVPRTSHISRQNFQTMLAHDPQPPPILQETQSGTMNIPVESVFSARGQATLPHLEPQTYLQMKAEGMDISESLKALDI
ncbi:hypothetical protein AB205_0097960, partial [Aquarana catesbeiana]